MTTYTLVPAAHAIAVIVMLLGASHAAPSEAGSAPYGAVDQSTVRVFSIGTVGVEAVERGGRVIQVASANAGHGTGFVVDRGLILTAHHVVKDARHVVVRLPGAGEFVGARVVFSDPEHDIAALAVQSEPAALTLSDKASPRVRESVFAVGYPIDPRRTQPQSARGIIAGFLDDGTIQLDMALNPGNSGGPLLGPNERVIGMVVARGDPKAGVQSIGYAIPTSRLAMAVAEAKGRVAAGESPLLDARSMLAADVVDRLIQRGTVDELSRDRDIGTTLRALITRVDDADLLVFIGARLWNASLSIELGLHDPRTTTLPAAEARRLADQLRRAAIDACKRATSVDAAIGQRSAFARFASWQAEPSIARVNWTSVPSEPRRSELRIRGTTEVRLNTASGSVGFGGGFGVSGLLDTGRGRVKPMLGTSFGRVVIAGLVEGDRFAHTFVSAEVGIGVRAGNWLFGAAYCPSYYWSTVTESYGEAGTASGSVWFHARAWIEYRVGAFVIGAGGRVLDGPTFWLEPLSLGVTL